MMSEARNNVAHILLHWWLYWCAVAITTRTGEYVQTYFHFSNFPYEKRHCVHVHTCSEKLSFWFRNVIYFLFLIIPRLWSLVSSYVYLVLDLKIFDHRIDRKIFDLLQSTKRRYIHSENSYVFTAVDDVEVKVEAEMKEHRINQSLQKNNFNF